MFAIVSKSAAYPVSRSVGSEQPDLGVTWISGDKAKAFPATKGMDADYAVAALTEDALIEYF